MTKFNFKGVYIIYDQNNNNEVVYIGSAYTRNIEKRLKQYVSEKDAGNSLMHAICKKEWGIKVKEIKYNDMKKAINMIKGFKIKGIRYIDLENQLIAEAQPKYNTSGNKNSNK